ncbi:MAG: sigma-54 dependent transcriptional regulator [Magnetospirillum sp. WYHS-4]
MTAQGRLLIVDDEAIALKNLEHIMRKEGYDVAACQSGAEALTLLGEREFDVVLTDLRMEQVDGTQVLKASRERHPEAEVIMITGYATIESAVDAMKGGAFHYIAKPYRLDEVRTVVAAALDKVRLRQENRRLREQIESLSNRARLVTRDPQMLKLLSLAERIAPTDCNVLITGESGTGKELVARFLHEHSHRRDGPFLGINCGAFNEELLANELFGHLKGAFTGAATDKKGLIRAATGGTLLLDEVTEMSPAMQVKLLRVIQEGEVLPLGATKPVPVDVRYVAATNRDIQQEMKGGTFRQDLYFRLNVVMLHVPPLSERQGDIPLLAHHFLNRYAILMRKDIKDISPAVLQRLMAHSYPGNVRELENIVERAVALCTGQVIDVAHLPDEFREFSLPEAAPGENRIPTLAEHEMEYIKWVLGRTGGNQTQAAHLLGIDRVSLWRKFKRRQA